MNYVQAVIVRQTQNSLGKSIAGFQLELKGYFRDFPLSGSDGFDPFDYHSGACSEDDFLMKRRILVTGGAGFIGSNVVDLLVEHEFDVVIVDNFVTGKVENINPKARVYNCDVGDEAFREIVRQEKPDCVIHHAAQIDVQTSIRKPEFDAEVNIVASINVLEACRLNGVRKVIYASSAALYGDPLYLPVDEDHPPLATSPYGISKYVVEHYLAMYNRLYGLNFTVLRYANVYGPRQNPLGEGGVIAIFSNRILSGKSCIVYGNGEQTRDFVYVEDVARANLLAIDRADNAVINVSSGTEVRVNSLLDVMKNVFGHDVEVEYAPARPGEILRSSLSNKRAMDLLGWKPEFDVESGIRKLLVYETTKSIAKA